MANVFSNIVEHPKTSIVGVLIAAVTIAGVLSQQGITLGNAGTGTIVALIAAIATALLGLLAKDPGASSSGSVSSISSAKLGVLMLISVMLMGSMAGCTGKQVAQDIVNWTPTIISTANVVGTTVSALAPQDAILISALVAGFDVTAQTISNQAQAYLANPNATLLQALQTQVSTFQQSVNSALLQAVKVGNLASQQRIIAAIQALSVGVNAVLALIATIKGNTVAASQAAIKVAQVEPLMDRRKIVAMVAAHYGESETEASVQVEWTNMKLAQVGF